MTSQWRHRNKTHSWYSELNFLQNVYLGFFYIWKTNRMTLFCNLFIERPSYLNSDAQFQKIKSAHPSIQLSTTFHCWLQWLKLVPYWKTRRMERWRLRPMSQRTTGTVNTIDTYQPTQLLGLSATKCQILRLKCTKIDFGRPRWGSLQHSPRALAGFKGPYF